MKRRIIILLSLLPVCLSSCVKTEVPAECPPTNEFALGLSVEDKNFEVAVTPKPETTPFADYVSSVYYVWHNADTGEEITSDGNLPVTGTEELYDVSLDGVPAVEHQFTAWGNLPDTDVITADGDVLLHPDGEESTDIYVVSQPINLSSGNEQAYNIGMTRTKGLLSLKCNDFPPTITRVEVELTNVSESVSADGTYSGAVDVAKSFDYAGEEYLDTLAAPTPDGTTSDLLVSLYQDGDTEPVVEFAAIDEDAVVIDRNVSTNLQVNYTDDGAWELAIMLDGAWSTVITLNPDI